MTEALRAMVRYAFEVMQMDVVGISHFTENARSRRVIEKCGFSYLGDGTYETRYGTTETVRDYILIRSF